MNPNWKFFKGFRLIPAALIARLNFEPLATTNETYHVFNKQKLVTY